MRTPLLLPAPKRLTLTGGACDGALPDASVTLDASVPHAEGYTLRVASDGVHITARTAAGAFYARATLAQLVRQYGDSVPYLVIEDWPDFAVRGVMLDVSRDRVPTMAMLRLWIDRLAALKINQLQLYMEHTFAYPSHPEVWRTASPFTADEIRELDALCQARHIDLVPCQNGFGHMERWLIHERYADLAITHAPRLSAMGDPRLPSTLNPLDPRSLELVASIYDDLLPHFSSRLFNASADEPFELGKGRTEAAVRERGKGRVYLDYLLALHQLVTARGRTMQFWGDIIIHYPELVPELPHDLIALDWGYEALHDFDAHAAVYAGAGVPFYLCPGTSSWVSLAGAVDNMLDNVRNAALAGQTHGALGILITDWGDNGHWQPPSVSLPGFAAAAAMSWNTGAHAAMTAADLAPLLDAHIYAGDVASAALALGNVYQRFASARINGSVLAYVLQRRLDEIPALVANFERWGQGAPVDISVPTVRMALTDIDAASEAIARAAIGAADGELIRAELLHAAAMLRHGAQRLLLMHGEPDVTREMLGAAWDALDVRQRELWLQRSREGGLADSLARFAIAREAYTSA